MQHLEFGNLEILFALWPRMVPGPRKYARLMNFSRYTELSLAYLAI